MRRLISGSAVLLMIQTIGLRCARRLILSLAAEASMVASCSDRDPSLSAPGCDPVVRAPREGYCAEG